MTTIDVGSLSLLGLAPIRASIEDVATPFKPFIGKSRLTDCTEDEVDGFDDLTLKFAMQDLIDALEVRLGRPVEDDETFALVITGNLQDGTLIEGQDVIVIKKKGK